MREKHAISYNEFVSLNTDQIRSNFLIKDLFKLNSIEMVYSYNDRMIIGGAYPQNNLELTTLPELCHNYFLERREMGIINIGGAGLVRVNDTDYQLNTRDGLYIGMGNKSVIFSSMDKENPAKFYFISTFAFTTYPTTKIAFADVEPMVLGNVSAVNQRVLYKYIHNAGVKSCQLVMGFTEIKDGSAWNSMPPHIHERRSEVYCYFNLPQEDIVFHFMGDQNQTRHIVVKNEQVILSPYWSIHSGVGTTNYAFIWAMSGENQLFEDAKPVQLKDLK